MHEAATEFIERIGLHLEGYGLSKIAGRMLGFFLVDGGSHSLGALSERLQISKGSASTNARLLERLGLLERHSRPGDRRDFYRLGSDPWRSMFEVTRERTQHMLELFEEGSEQLPAEMEEARERLRTWGKFQAFILDEIDDRIERWEARRMDAPVNE